MTASTLTGEPYELAGKRIVFTNWYYVRPGSFSWVDDKGQGVAVVGSHGPWGAHFRRHDYPHGIRLVAQPAQRVGPDGQPIKGRTFADATPVIGDQYRALVTWKDQDDLGYQDGAHITLRFRMDKAKLFGLEFE